MPNAYTYPIRGIADYKFGNYSSSVNTLQMAYDLASREGEVRIRVSA